MRSSPPVVCVLAAIAMSSCVRVVSPPSSEGTASSPATPRVVNVPKGCTDDFAGTWVHADDPSYAYRAEDDGGALVLTAFRAWAHSVDGGIPDAGSGALAAQITLQRTENGFTGITQAQAVHPSGGRTCPVSFSTEVIRCEDGGLTLRSATVASLGETCQPGPSTVAPIMLEHRLARADAGGL